MAVGLAMFLLAMLFPVFLVACYDIFKPSHLKVTQYLHFIFSGIAQFQ